MAAVHQRIALAKILLVTMNRQALYLARSVYECARPAKERGLVHMIENITNDLYAAYGDDVIIDHIIPYGPGTTVVLYRTIKTRQHRVAVYDGDGESEFDLVIGEEMDWERAMSIVGQNDEEED